MSPTTTKSSKLPSFISMLIVIALGVSLAKLMWLVIAPQNEFSFNNQQSEIKTQVKRKQINYGKLIADQHIFGEVKKKEIVKKEESKKPEIKPVVKAKINAKLHGIVAYKSANEGYALISLNNGPQKVYGKGENLQEGVVVNDILPGKVILDNRGDIEELLLPKDVSSNKSTRKNSFASANRRAAPTRTNSLPGVGNAQNLVSGNVPNLEEFRQEAIQNPSKLMDVVRPSPAIVDGQFVGFRVQPGRKRKLFRSLGFLPNDIVTEVNGIVLDDQSKGTMVLGELAQAADISIKVKRGKQEVFLQQSF